MWPGGGKSDGGEGLVVLLKRRGLGHRSGGVVVVKEAAGHLKL